MAKRIDPRCFPSLIDANVLDRLDDGHDDAGSLFFRTFKLLGYLQG